MRIFLTGDNHIGLKYANHPQATELRKQRISAFQDMVDRANRECCALFIISGDLFENNDDISKKDIESLLNMLSQFRGTVVVVPGNHDFYNADAKVWEMFKNVMLPYDNIMLLTEFKPYTLTCGEDDVCLYPALCTAKHSESGKNNLDWIKNTDIIPDNTYRIGIAHGAIEGETIDREGSYFLMKRTELESIPLDLWLIGHTHVPFPKDLKEDQYTACEKILNAGTHVQTDVNCNTDGECFVIEISKSKTITAKKFVSGNIRFYRKSITVLPGAFETTLTENLKDIADHSVVDLIIDGTVNEEEYETRHCVTDKVLSRFMESTYNDSALSQLITKKRIEEEFPETSISARLLSALLDNSKETQLAYELLKSLKETK